MSEIPLCACGCGKLVKVINHTNNAKNYHKGSYHRYLRGHKMAAQKRIAKKWDVNPATGCWQWLCMLNRQGYGNIRLGKNKHVLAHRYVYKLYKGEIPDNKPLDHLCRNRSCVNPDHLEPVTHTENLRRGLSAKLSMEKATEIRRLYTEEGMSKNAIAKLYGVCFTTIYQVLKGNTWN